MEYPWVGGKQKLPKEGVDFFRRLHALKPFDYLGSSKGPKWVPDYDIYLRSEKRAYAHWFKEESGLVKSIEETEDQFIIELVGCDYLVAVHNKWNDALMFWKKK